MMQKMMRATTVKAKIGTTMDGTKVRNFQYRLRDAGTGPSGDWPLTGVAVGAGTRTVVTDKVGAVLCGGSFLVEIEKVEDDKVGVDAVIVLGGSGWRIEVLVILVELSASDTGKLSTTDSAELSSLLELEPPLPPWTPP